MLHEFTDATSDAPVVILLSRIEAVWTVGEQVTVQMMSGVQHDVAEPYETVVNVWAQAVEGGS